MSLGGRERASWELGPDLGVDNLFGPQLGQGSGVGVQWANANCGPTSQWPGVVSVQSLALLDGGSRVCLVPSAGALFFQKI
jgi:hypothetical protein